MPENKGKEPYWIGFDLGGTKMQATVFNDDFEVVSSKRKKTKAQEGVTAGLERIERTIDKALENADLKYEDIAGIGVGSPGPLDLDKGIVLDTPNLGWKNVKLKARLEKTFNCPVVVANDVDAGVYGEYRYGAAKGARCVLGVFPGTGIGGGCVYEGHILRGEHASCLEIGHMKVLPEGPLCGCGQRGCLEALASRLAISSAAVVAAYRGDAPHLLEESGMDLSNVRSGALCRSIEAGDSTVEQIVRDAARWLGIGVANVINLLAPDMVVLGGGLVEAIPELYVEEVRTSAREHVMTSFRDAFKVVASKLGDDAAVTGGAALIHDMVNEKNS